MPQLAGLIRSKYPGDYDDLSDADLEKLVLEKYPEYKDLTKSNEAVATEPAKQEGSLLDKLKPILENPHVQRFFTGFSDADKAELAKRGITSIGGSPSETSILPELEHPKDEGWPGYIARGLYNQVLRPLGSPSGWIGAGMPAKAKPGELAGAATKFASELKPLEVASKGVRIGDQITSQLAKPVKLYRWESEKGPGVPDWVKDNPDYQSSQNAAGSWYTDKPENLEFYKKDSGGKGKVIQIEVTPEEANRFKVSNNSEAAKFSADPESEYFIPKENRSTASTQNEAIQAAKTLPREKFVEEYGRQNPNSPGLTSISEMIAKKGKPGIKVESTLDAGIKYNKQIESPHAFDKAIVYRDENGEAKGILRLNLGDTNKPIASPEVWVDPNFRRQGIATKLYDKAKEAGYDLSEFSGDALTKEGAELFYSRMQGKPQTAVDKLKQAIADTKPLSKEQASIRSIELSEKAGKVADVTTPGEAGHVERLGKMKGELTKLSTEPLKLDQPDVDELFNQIYGSNRLQEFEQVRGGEALRKVFRGELLQNNERLLLNRIFGADTIPLTIKGRIINESVNFFKSVNAAQDLSIPFSQGRGLIHTKAWWGAWDDQVKSFGFQKSFDDVMESVSKSKYFDLASNKDVRLALTGYHNYEEGFGSRLAEKIPLVKRSERAASAFMAKLRMDNFDALVDKAIRIGTDPETKGLAAIDDPRKNLVLAKQIATYINNASSRGSLGKLEPVAEVFNSVFFAPRRIAATLHMMNFYNYLNPNVPGWIRREYLKSLGSIVGSWGIFAGLAALGGASVVLDPDNADFGKIRFGNTRINPSAGFASYITAFARLRPNLLNQIYPGLGGGFTSSTSGKHYELGSKFGGQDADSIIMTLFKNRENPLFRYLYGMATASKLSPFLYGDETLKSFMSMTLKDTIEIIKEDPNLLPITIPSSILGADVQNYEGGKKKEGLLLPF